MTPRLAGGIILSVLAVCLAWWLPNRATTEAFPAGPLDSVSFAPYRPGQSPLTTVSPTASQVAEDMALLAPHVRAVRTYTALGALADVPALARVNRLKVWQGIWLGPDPVSNARDIAAGIALANDYPDVIDRVIVGNEVLLRRDLTPEALIAAIDRVRAQVRQPVAYAEVWQFWQKYPQVAAHVDQVLVHLLPFWEDRPLAIERAVGEELGYYREIQALFPDKPIVVGETGWPSLGRQREEAAPGRVNQARYLRQFTQEAARQGIEYNVIEAFDQDWKASLEGTVGSAWGLWTSDRKLKFPPGRPVRDDPAWGWHAAASVLFGMLLLADRRLRSDPTTIVAADLALTFSLGAALVWAWAETLPVALGPNRQLFGSIDLAVQAVLAWLLVTRPEGDRLLGALIFAFLIGALMVQTLLLIDPRYRDFPTPAFAVPLVGAIRALRRTQAGSANRRETLAALALIGMALAGAVQEGMDNIQSLLWCVVALALAAPPVIGRLRSWRLRLPRPAVPDPRGGAV
jgi:exo-beta-1,3-glucanase (GH17 family)